MCIRLSAILECDDVEGGISKPINYTFMYILDQHYQKSLLARIKPQISKR